MERIGTDESGKGDYFGPLVVASVHVGPNQEKVLDYYGVKDCKRLTDRRVLELEPKIRGECVHDIVRINPHKYNILYRKFENLNVLLAWAHARAIENILKKVKCGLVITDKFAAEKYLKDMYAKDKKKYDDYAASLKK